MLDIVTNYRLINQWLIFLLPLAGVFLFYLYNSFGKELESGSNLILDKIKNPSIKVPIILTPLITFATVFTHLFGGSAGREGTAVQIGGSIASYISEKFNLSKEQTSLLVISGIAAGFGAVFGTPFAGGIFAIEVITIGKKRYSALVYCIISSYIANIVCFTYGTKHTKYIINSIFQNQILNQFHFEYHLLLKVILAGVIFGFVALIFSRSSHLLKNKLNSIVKTKWLIPVIGGIVIILLSYLLNTFDFLGLGVKSNNNGASIVNSFYKNGVNNWSWFWKFVFTLITLSTGFKGGEVTPLFFIGAALGNTLAVYLNAPIDLFAGLGFIAIFAGATNTPFASSIMGIELFGYEFTIYFFIVSYVAYFCTGQNGIYLSQGVFKLKYNNKTLEKEITLKEINNDLL